MARRRTARPATEALFITGTVGAGKTTTLEAASSLLAADRVPHATINLDDLRRAWPSPPGDPFNLAVESRNLTAVASNYVEAGASRLLLAGVIGSLVQRRSYEEALNSPLVVCRLDADLTLVQQRLKHRHDGDASALRWHLDRVTELDAILRAARVEDFVVDVASFSPREIAHKALAAAGWARPA